MTFHSTTMEVGQAVFDAFTRVGRDDTRGSADRAAVFLFVAGGLLLTVAFFMAGFGAEIGQILAVSG
jgi:hypothetical protein